MQQRTTHHGEHAPEPIAVIGMGCRFPGARGPSELWRLLRDGVDAVTEVPADRWDADAFFDEDADKPGKMNTRWGGFIKDVDLFDPHFFKIAPREAAHLDPQQRLLLEVTWEALEDAGQAPDRLAGTRTGVFVGIMGNDYGDAPMNDPESVNFYTFPGIARCIAANRLSYFFDFRGPSMAVDTACSSSLVAVHLACKSLWAGESTLAVAGGVNLILSPEGTIWYTKAGLMARDGRCKTFDARADGLVRGEGAGVVILKPLSKALADGDRVHAVVLGGAVNQDGRSNGLTAPNRRAQEAVIRGACAQAGVEPRDIGYVEAHGTGTTLGDPIEVKALGAVLAEGRPAGDHCAIGSVKTNIGHLEAAAGVAGLLKVVLMLKHRELAPSLHFRTPNPHIPFAQLPLRVQQRLAPWRPAGEALLAGVNSFGFGGTNAHVILGAAPRSTPDGGAAEGAKRSSHLLPLSARTPESLRLLAAAYRRALCDGQGDDDLQDVCHTAGARRSHHEHRLALCGATREELRERLDDFLSGAAHPAASAGRASLSRRPKVAFVFSGQGPQWWAMGRQLLAGEKVFREAVEECDSLFRREAGWSLLEELAADEGRSRVAQTEVAQPTIFALQVGLAALWRSWGVEPDAVVGHSVGEAAAAHAAGALSLTDAVSVVFHRSRLMQRATGLGRMAAVELSVEEAALAVAGREQTLSLAAHNGPRSCVLSGETAALEELIEDLRRRGVRCQLLRADYAFHAPQMGLFADELTRSLSHVEPRAAATPLFSTLSGGACDGRGLDAGYWARQMREPVLFAPAAGALAESGHGIFFELGPHPVLGQAVTDCAAGRGREVAALASLRRGEDERGSLLKSLGRFYTLGGAPDWGRAQGGRCASLPTYQWERSRYWLPEQETRNERNAARRAASRAADPVACHALLGRGIASAAQPGVHLWETEIDTRRLSHLGDHRVRGEVILPAAHGAAMALAAGAEVFGAAGVEASQVSFERPARLAEGEALRLQFVVTRDSESAAGFELFSRKAAGEWELHARGRLEAVAGGGGDDARATALDEVKRRCGAAISADEFYDAVGRRGLEYGARFRWIEQVWTGEGEALARVVTPEALAPESASHEARPLLLDNCLQVIAGALPGLLSEDGETYVPVGLGRVRVLGRAADGRAAWCHAAVRAGAQASSLEADVLLFDESGRAILKLGGVRLQRLSGGLSQHGSEEREGDTAGAALEGVAGWLYELRWRLAETKDDGAGLGGASTAPGAWVIFADGRGVGDAVADGLKARGARCVVVRKGEDYGRGGDGAHLINPARVEDYERLFNEAFGPSRPARTGLLHLWSMDDGAEPADDFAAPGRADGCRSILHLVQALDRVGGAGSARLWVGTSGAHPACEGAATASVAQSPAWGLGRVVAQELPSTGCTLIDLAGEATGADAEALLADLTSGSAESQIAWRGGRRYVARLARRSPRPGRQVAIDPGGTYLVTGGGGGLGLRVARRLVERGALNLLLVGRSGLTAEARASVAELEARGARVVFAAADAAEAGQLARALSEARATLPALKGVVHAAGVVDDAPLRDLDAGRLARVLAPKVSGAWNLHRLTLDAELDFFVLFSSLSSVFGNAGQGGYAAGNAFLDALAHYRRSSDLPALSINWGPWAETGMAAGHADALARRGVGSIRPDEGLAVFESLLGGDDVQVIASPFEWAGFAAHYPRLAAEPFMSEVVGDGAAPETAAGRAATPARGSALAARLGSALPAEAASILAGHIQELARGVLGLPASHRPDAAQGFFEMGMDSLMLAELHRRLSADSGASFPLSALFDHGNAEALARHVAGIVAPAPARDEAAPAADEQEINLALDELERLSDEEAFALLAGKLGMDGTL